MLMPSIFGENLFDGFFDDFAFPMRKLSGFGSSNNMMRTDIKDQDDSYQLAIDLPGFKKEDVQAELKDGYLTINATSNQSNDEKDDQDRYIRRERYYGSCTRSFYVGEDVTEEDIKAKFQDGTLNIVIPKKDPQPQVETKKYIAIEG